MKKKINLILNIWVKDFFIRKGEDTVILPHTHIEELEFRFDEDLN